MEKLKRYNQILLAILGTLAIAGLVIWISAGLFLFLDKIISDNHEDSETDPSLMVSDTSTKPGVDAASKDLVFEDPILVDSLQAIYIIPVSQVNLKNNQKPVAKAGFDSDSYESSSRKYYHRVTGVYNNIIVYDRKNNKKEIVFQKKVFLSSLSFHTLKHYVILEGTTTDSNNDRKLNEDDLQSFFIYTIDNNRLSELNFEKHSALEFDLLYDSDELLLEYGIDKNEDGEFWRAHEPTILKKYDLATGVSSDFLDADALAKMKQQIN